MRHRIPAAQLVAALASVGAGAVHIAVTADHWSLWWVYGVQFLAAALIQFGLAIAMLIGRSRTLLAGSVVVQAVFIGAWAVTRTLGRPFGPAAGAAEAVGYPDVLTVLLEVIAVAGALLAMARGGRPALARGAYLASSSAAGTIVLAAASIAVLTAVTGGHHESGGHHGTGGHHGSGGHHETSGPQGGSGHHDRLGQDKRTTEGPSARNGSTGSTSPPESTPAPATSTGGSDGHTHEHG